MAQVGGKSLPASQIDPLLAGWKEEGKSFEEVYEILMKDYGYSDQGAKITLNIRGWRPTPVEYSPFADITTEQEKALRNLQRYGSGWQGTDQGTAVPTNVSGIKGTQTPWLKPSVEGLTTYRKDPIPQQHQGLADLLNKYRKTKTYDLYKKGLGGYSGYGALTSALQRQRKRQKRWSPITGTYT